jgi:hypothetical protein
MPFFASNALTGAVEIVQQRSQVLAQLTVSFDARGEPRQPRVLSHTLGRNCGVTRGGPYVRAKLLVTEHVLRVRGSILENLLHPLHPALSKYRHRHAS